MATSSRLDANGPGLSPRQLEKAPARSPSISLDDVILDESKLDQELALLFSQYLRSRSQESAASFVDQELLGQSRDESRRNEILEVERAILDGDFLDVESLLVRNGLVKAQTQKAFLYMCYRQQFLEYIENRESQKAFNLLQKRLKPLEHYQPVPYDFYNLAYLTSAATVHDAPSFRDWEGAGPERERLVGMWRELMNERSGREGVRHAKVPPDRLLTLLKQAAAWQIQSSRREGKAPWAIGSLLKDYHVSAMPVRLRLAVTVGPAKVKCVDFLGESSSLAVVGSSDSNLRIVSSEDGSIVRILSGHSSRIWNCQGSASGYFVASASGDGSVRVWSTADGGCRTILEGSGGDLTGQDQIVSASYDKILRLWDVETGKQIRTFTGHSQSTLAVAFDDTGGLIASGSKDKHIRLWDAVGGVCVQTFTGCLGEITSVEFDEAGKYLLVGCKDNSNRLWDLRMQRNLYRYTGHQNTSKNLIRCSFALYSSLIVGGSEDGLVHLWAREPAAPASRVNGLLPPNDSIAGPLKAMPTSPPNLFSPSTSQVPVLTKSSASRSSPAYYPPKQIQKPPSTASSGTSVRPMRVLAGHGEGAVFDVNWRGAEMVSAGEDGVLGIWGSEEDEEDQPVISDHRRLLA